VARGGLPPKTRKKTNPKHSKIKRHLAGFIVDLSKNFDWKVGISLILLGAFPQGGLCQVSLLWWLKGSPNAGRIAKLLRTL
jgi:hypothetical protein